MVHYQQRAVAPMQLHHHQQQVQMQLQVQMQPQQTHPVNMQQRHHQQEAEEDDDLVGLTVEEAGIDQTSPLEDTTTTCSTLHDYPQSGCAKCASNQNQGQQQPQHEKDKNKENQPPGYHPEQLTYLDLDKTPSVLKERSSSNASTSTTTTNTTTTSPVCLKRRRAVSEWETEEAVQSILPKRRCSSVESIVTSDEDDSVFLDNASQLSEAVSKNLEETKTTPNTSSMDSIDRITSLVSIFSFGMTSTPTENTSNATSGNGKLSSNRSVSTPDLCSSQAKEGDAIQQRPFLAMTV